MLSSLTQLHLRDNLSDCRFAPPGNAGLTLPDTQEFRSADLDGDGMICGVAIGSDPAS